MTPLEEFAPLTFTQFDKNAFEVTDRNGVERLSGLHEPGVDDAEDRPAFEASLRFAQLIVESVNARLAPTTGEDLLAEEMKIPAEGIPPLPTPQPQAVTAEEINKFAAGVPMTPTAHWKAMQDLV